MAQGLRPFSLQKDPRILVGTEGFDDAGVYLESDDLAHVSSTDFFHPIVDDPFHFGAIAAANALSDLYAMGASPRFALNIVGFPQGKLDSEILSEILKGGLAKTKEAGIPIIGGHSIQLATPTYGLVVHGVVHPDKIIRNNQLIIEDRLILTKPLGIGVIVSAIRRNQASQEMIEEASKMMMTLNRKAGELMVKYEIKAATDVTGFGLLGHLKEMVVSSGVQVEIAFDAFQFITGSYALARKGIFPKATSDNLQSVKNITEFDPNLSQTQKMLLADAQTSGGLLIACRREKLEPLKNDLLKQGCFAQELGLVTKKGTPKIMVTEKGNLIG